MPEYTISKDGIYLREQARQNMQAHLQDRLPEEYENCMAGIKQVLKMSWELLLKARAAILHPVTVILILIVIESYHQR